MRSQDGYGVEVIATGDEILFGRIVDTNSAWIARRVAELGARLRRITCIGDDMAEIGIVLMEALNRGNELIITTGGLGPSQDDITVDAIGKALKREVELNPEAVELLRRKCVELGVEMTPRRERMARLVDGGAPIPNPAGMAPGMLLTEGSTAIVSLPGVPAEMKAIFDGSVAPMIAERTGSRFTAETVSARIVFKDFFPIYESMMRDFPEAYIKNAATPPTTGGDREKVTEIKVDIVVEAASKEEGERKIVDLLGEFRKRLEAKGGELIL